MPRRNALKKLGVKGLRAELGRRFRIRNLAVDLTTNGLVEIRGECSSEEAYRIVRFAEQVLPSNLVLSPMLTLLEPPVVRAVGGDSFNVELAIKEGLDSVAAGVQSAGYVFNNIGASYGGFKLRNPLIAEQAADDKIDRELKRIYVTIKAKYPEAENINVRLNEERGSVDIDFKIIPEKRTEAAAFVEQTIRSYAPIINEARMAMLNNRSAFNDARPRNTFNYQVQQEIARLQQKVGELEGLNGQAIQKIEQMQNYIEREVQPAFAIGTVLRILADREIQIGTPQGAIKVKLPAQMPEPKPGDQLWYNMKSGAIDKPVVERSTNGRTALVSNVKDGKATISDAAGERSIMVLDPAVGAGDKVVLDQSGEAAAILLEKGSAAMAKANEGVNVAWDDIGGAHEAKQAMREAVELPILHAALFAHYGKKAPKGVLLYGPPGCGKTLLGKAAATSLAISGGEGSFLYVKGPELLSKWVGEAEAAVRRLFESARRHKQEKGYPALIFIDEAESLLGARGGMGAGIGGGMEKTIVPMFLAEMDGLADTSAIVVLATNRPESLDPAVVREGRIDRKVRVSRPGREEAEAIAAIHLRGKPTRVGPKAVVAALYSPELALYRATLRDGGEEAFTLAHLMSGAMIAQAIEEAASIAIRRDMALPASEWGGIVAEDFAEAAWVLLRGNADVNHNEALEDFVAPMRANVKAISKAA